MIHGDLRPTRALAISVAEAPSITTRQWFSRHVDAKDRGLCCLRCVVSALGLNPREDTPDTSSPQAEIWPNDDGFETLEMRRAVWERERARREKALAEEALQARQEAEQATFVASLSEAQLRWLKHEAKRRVDAKPASGFVQSRYTRYKVEEDNVIREWMDRAAYGEQVAPAEQPDEHRSI
jgi:hypothetical protein